MRPAVSVGRTTALDELNHTGFFDNLADFDGNSVHQNEFSSFFDLPEPNVSDHLYPEARILPVTDNFNLNFDHMDGHNDNVLEGFDISEFLHQHDEQPAPEIQSTDAYAETTASLQPQFGASSNGCDDGAIAVSV